MDDFFRAMTLSVCGSLDIQRSVEAAWAVVRRALPADGLGLGYSDLERARMEVVAWAGARRPWLGPRSAGFQMNDRGAHYVRYEGAAAPSPLFINRPEQASAGLLALFPGMRTHSVLFLRLELQGEEIGALMVWAEGRDRYTEAHAALLESVVEPLTMAMVNARQYRELQEARDRLAEDHRALSHDLHRSLGTEVVGADFGLREVMERVRRIAPSSRPALLLGETGTGKEVIANAIHRASPRSEGPFITLQCGAVPDSLLDAELFGHERGAFTGAHTRKRGRFERAHQGTLFLDEVGELTPDAQVKLLRVLQEGRVERIGGDGPIPVDVRVIAATHRDLAGMVRAGRFRQDLWYRLEVLPIHLPPLRARRADIPSLVHHFLARRARELGRPLPRLSVEDAHRLSAYDWPGNVRELQNVVERALLLSDGDELVVPPLASLGGPEIGPGGSGSLAAAEPIVPLAEAMAAHIRRALEQTGGQIAGRRGAAGILGLKPSTLRNRMSKLGLL